MIMTMTTNTIMTRCKRKGLTIVQHCCAYHTGPLVPVPRGEAQPRPAGPHPAHRQVRGVLVSTGGYDKDRRLFTELCCSPPCPAGRC